MKYLINTLAILCLGISTSWALPDFRLCKWGDTKAQVRATEELELTSLDSLPDVLATDMELEGIEVFLLYYFNGEKLTSADYLLRDSFENAQQHWSAYYKLESLLQSKYGLGVRYHGIAAGISTWTTPTTKIWLVYDSGLDSYKISLSYSSRELNYLTDTQFEMEEY